MIRLLAISFFASAVFASCSLKTTEGLRALNTTKFEVENRYFSNPEIDYVYKAKIEVYGKNFGGILIVKKLGLENHRIVFTTEFGSKLFDFQFEGDAFTKHFVAERLDKKFIIKILRHDFKLLVNEKANVVASYKANSTTIYKTITGKRFNFYYFDDDSGQLQKIVNTSKTKEKMEIVFMVSEENTAEAISIKHSNIKLKIDLEKFKK